MSALLRSLAVLGFAAVAGHAQGSTTTDNLPPAFPREGAIKVLDNARGTAWEARWAPNVPTPLHKHPFDYVGIELADATFRVTAPGADPRTSSRKAGDSWFLPRGVVHSEEGLSTPGRHAVVIDLKDSTAPARRNTGTRPTAFTPGAATAGTQVVDNARVTMWSMALSAGTAAPAPSFYDRDAFLVVVDAGTISSSQDGGRAESRAVVPGQVIYRPGGSAWSDWATKGSVRMIVVLVK